MILREETAADAEAIAALVTAAFRNTPHSSGTEAAIVAALRRAGALSLSLVAEEARDITGYIAFSPVTTDNNAADWYGLGPLAVHPARQKRGIGAALVEAGLSHLREKQAAGCVVLGDPAYYRRFGFTVDDRLRYPEAPAPYFMQITLQGGTPAGIVRYHAAFAATTDE